MEKNNQYKKKHIRTDGRNQEQVIEHYEIEKKLASKLMNASKSERKQLYGELYDELYRRVPHHPMLQEKVDPKKRETSIKQKLSWLSRYFSNESTYMEIGPGDCLLSFELCKHFKRVYAIDVSEEITSSPNKPTNFKLFLSDGSSIDVEADTIDLAFSNQLMEHLHPDDALDQLQGIYKALAKGGVYFCITPHRFMGPCDVSMYFDEVATGFHLKEYTNKELYLLFKSAGFRKINSVLTLRGNSVIIPTSLIIALEGLIKPLPYSYRKKISKMWLTSHLLSIKIVATK